MVDALAYRGCAALHDKHDIIYTDSITIDNVATGNVATGNVTTDNVTAHGT